MPTPLSETEQHLARKVGESFAHKESTTATEPQLSSEKKSVLKRFSTWFNQEVDSLITPKGT
jgi:hypothetical protein